MKKPLKLKKSTPINRVKKGFRAFYSSLEMPFLESRKKAIKKAKEFNKEKNDVKWIREIMKTNKICRNFYKRPELEINDLNNVEVVQFKSRDNVNLFGLLYTPNENSNKWVIGSHWFAGHKNWALHHAKIFTKFGYNVLVYDFRGHGHSQEDSTTMGWKEKEDLMGAVHWLRDNKEIESLFLMGTSMGAFVSNYCAMAYKDEFKKLNLQGIVSDVTYGSVFNLFLHIKNIYLGLVPKRKAKKFISKMIEKLNKKEGNINLYEISIFHLLKNYGNKDLFPTLFLASTDDKVVSPTDTYELILQRGFEKDDYLVFNFSFHTQAIRYHFKAFNYKIAEFINKIEPNDEKFESIVSEWGLLNFEKSDQLSLLLK